MVKGRKRLIGNSIVALVTLIAYFCTTISPANYGWAGFFALLVPLLIITNFIFFFHWFLKKSPKLFISLIVILIGFSYLKSSINFSFTSSKAKKKGYFSVMSYNVKVFNVYNHLQGKDSINAKNLIRQVVEDSSDIKCLQEFFCEDNSKVFNTIARINQDKKYYYITTPKLKKRHNYFGLAIFSKYPIINSGEIIFPKSKNKSHFADIKIKNDIVRVYNVHFQSISLDESKMFDNESYEEFKETYDNVFERMKKGFQKRAKQADLLVEHIKKSPYPVIVCGDFNDTPYSYTYTSFKNILSNAFEKAGSGFDFSYNGKMFFLRIDNQFFNEKLKIHYFETDRKMSYSDHFPLKAIYEVIKP